MPTLYIDMPSGVAGDMLLAALLACGGDRELVERDLLALGCGPIRIHAKPVRAGPLAAILAHRHHRDAAAPRRACGVDHV